MEQHERMVNTRRAVLAPAAVATLLGIAKGNPVAAARRLAATLLVPLPVRKDLVVGDGTLTSISASPPEISSPSSSKMSTTVPH